MIGKRLFTGCRLLILAAVFTATTLSMAAEPVNDHPPLLASEIWEHHALILSLGVLSFVLVSLLSIFLIVSRRGLTNQHAQLVLSEFRWKFAIEGSKDGLWDWDCEQGKVFYSDSWKSMLGLSGARVSDDLSEWHKRIHPLDRDSVLKEIDRVIHAQDSICEREYRMLHKDGCYIWVLDRSMVVSRAFDGTPQRIIGTLRDITARKQAEEDYRLSRQVFESTHDGIIITDTEKRIVDVNPAFCEITGYEREEVIGRQAGILKSGLHDQEYYRDMWERLENQGHWQREIWNHKKNGELYAELLTISAIRDERGVTTHYVGLFSDITEIKSHQQSLERMAHYDQLTQLPNRALFTDRIQQSIAQTDRSGKMLAVCFLDLDHFKPINDQYGHNAGDEILIAVARRLRDCLRTGDTLCRYGGDEFALLLNDLNSYDGCEFILSRILLAISEPIKLNGRDHVISVSVGATIYPEDKSTPDVLLRHADQAMYKAKSAGRNDYCFFQGIEDIKERSEVARLNEIRAALKNSELQLYYQPKVNISTGKVIGVEALIRWRHPQRSLLTPAQFLPLIERSDLEILVGNWVMEEAFRQAGEWQKQGIDLNISINISSYHLLDASFMGQLQKMIAAYPDSNPAKMELEVLESGTFENVSHISDLLRHCRDIYGLQISLDDFGTGYSSLTHLRNLPTNSIKIDQSFIRDMLDDPHDYMIVDGVIGLCESFDLDVIAEGVETTEHGLMLLTMGCELAQGFGIGRPMPAGELSDWLSAFRPNEQWLAFSQNEYSVKQKKIELFRMYLQRWLRRINAKIADSTGENEAGWPLLGKERTLSGQWLDQAKHHSWFDPDWLQQLENLHESAQQRAMEIVSLHRAGNAEQLELRLQELTEMVDRQIQWLNSSSDHKPHSGTRTSGVAGISGI